MPDKWVLVLGSLAAGLLSMVVVVLVDLTLPHSRAGDLLLIVFGPIFGPLLVSLACVPRLRWRALGVALGGYLVELVIVIAFLGLVSQADWS